MDLEMVMDGNGNGLRNSNGNELRIRSVTTHHSSLSRSLSSLWEQIYRSRTTSLHGERKRLSIWSVWYSRPKPHF